MTLIELVVALALMGVLLAISLPAIHRVRATARRASCASNLHQLGIAICAYEQGFRYFPPGNTNRFSIFVSMLSQLDQARLFQRVDFSDPESPANRAIRNTQLDVLLCPADGAANGTLPAQPCNYAGNEGTGVQAELKFNGFFQPISKHPDWGGGPLGARDVTDGLSNTIAFSEILIGAGSGAPMRTIWNVSNPMGLASQMDEFAAACEGLDLSGQTGDTWSRGSGWMRGDVGPTLYNQLQSPNHRSCYNGTHVPTGAYPPVSLHVGGVNVTMGDGSTRFVNDQIDIHNWRALGTRAGGEFAPLP